MSDPKQEYVPEKVWKWQPGEGCAAFANINRPIAGSRHEKELPVGKHDLQLYSFGSPNGQKVAVLLEELLELGIKKADYDAWLIDIREGDQFGSGFVEVNPNSKIPALLDRSDPDKPLRVFESGSILLYLAEKFDSFLPKDLRQRTETLNWLFWQMGSAPFVGGGFGHFYFYAPVKIKYAIDRYAMETKRQLDVLNRQLEKHTYIAGEEYTIADIAIFPWYGRFVLGGCYGDSATFLSVQDYPHVKAWADRISARPAVQRGMIVNKDEGGLRERHSESDFSTVD